MNFEGGRRAGRGTVKKDFVSFGEVFKNFDLKKIDLVVFLSVEFEFFINFD